MQKNVILQPTYRPMILPIGSPNIMATDVPVTIMLRARDENVSGTILTARGETMDQNMEWAHATPILDIISM